MKKIFDFIVLSIMIISASVLIETFIPPSFKIGTSIAFGFIIGAWKWSRGIMLTFYRITKPINTNYSTFLNMDDDPSCKTEARLSVIDGETDFLELQANKYDDIPLTEGMKLIGKYYSVEDEDLVDVLRESNIDGLFHANWKHEMVELFVVDAWNNISYKKVEKICDDFQVNFSINKF